MGYRHIVLEIALLLIVCGEIAAADIVKGTRILWNGSGKEQWTVFWPKEKGGKIWSVTKDKSGTLLTIAASSAPIELPFYEPQLKTEAVLHGAVEIAQEVELLGGEGVTVSLLLIDEDRELFALAARTLTPGKNTLSWRLPLDISAYYSMGGKANRQIDGNLKLWEYEVIRAPGTEAKIRLAEARVTENRSVLDFIDARVVTGQELNLILLPEKVQKPELVVRNAAEQEVALSIDLAVRTWDGLRESMNFTTTIAPHGEQRFALPESGTPVGIRWAEFSLRCGETTRYGKSSWAVMQPVRNPEGYRENGFLLGICTHASWWKKEIRDREFLAMSLIGTDIVRDGPGWANIEQEKGTYRWEVMDEMVERARLNGMEIQGNSGSCAKWAAAEEKRKNPNHLIWLFSAPVNGWDDWQEFNRRLAERYCGKIRFYEVGNETDLEFFWNSTVDDYIKFLRLAYAGIKAGDPQAQVMTCGFSGIGEHAGKRLNPDMQQRVIAQAQDSFDVHAFHQHGTFDLFQTVVEEKLPDLRKSLKTPKPLYFNETAMHSTTAGEKAQAEALYKKLLLAWGTGALGYTWYDLRNDGEDLKDPEHNYGMLTHDFRPKAVYLAFRTIADLLGHATCQGRLQLKPDTYGWEFRDGNRFVTAAWTEKPLAPQQVLAYRVGVGANAYEYDLMGNRQTLTVCDNVVFWPVTQDCRFLVMDSPSAVPQRLADPVSVTAFGAGRPQKPLEITVLFRNPFPDRKQEFVYEWQIPDGLRIAGTAGSSCVADGGAEKLIATTFLPQRCPTGNEIDRGMQLRLQWQLKGTNLSGTLLVPVKMDFYIAANGFMPPEPAFRLESEDCVRNFFANDPSNRKYVWGGRKDLSAGVWVGLQEENLAVRVEATDDEWNAVVQPKADLWKGDSIQLGLLLPGQKGAWEIGLACGTDGAPVQHLWMVPPGLSMASGQIKARTSRNAGGASYELTIPLKALGTDREALRKGLRFNLIVNDNDQGQRKGWVQIAPGLGESKNSGLWPLLFLE